MNKEGVVIVFNELISKTKSIKTDYNIYALKNNR